MLVTKANPRRAYLKWNEAIEECETEYLSLPHSDDIYLPTFLEESVAWLDAHPDAAAVFTLDYLIDAEGNRVGQTSLNVGEEKDQYGYKDILDSTLKRGNVLRCETVTLRVSKLEGLRYADTCGTANDTKMWLDIAAKHPIGIIAKPLVMYRQHPGSDTQKNVVGNVAVWDAADALWQSMEEHKELVPPYAWIGVGKTLVDRKVWMVESQVADKVRRRVPVTLYVVHEPPENAGTGVLVADRVRKKNADPDHLHLYVEPTQTERFGKGVWVHPSRVPTISTDSFTRVLQEFPPTRIEYHHFLRWNPKELLDNKVPKDMFIHDHHHWCARFHAVPKDEMAVCGFPVPERCDKCFAEDPKHVALTRGLKHLIADNLSAFENVYANSRYTQKTFDAVFGRRPEVFEWEVPELTPRSFTGRVGYFGSVYHVKGIFELIAVSRLMPDVLFLAFCDGPPSVMFTHRIPFGLPNVLFMGAYHRPELPALANLIDVGFFPSINETWGLCVRELKSLGVPVVATKVGGMESIGTVERGDVQGMAIALQAHLCGPAFA